MNSWFLLVHCSGSNIIFCLGKSQLAGRRKIKTFFRGPRICTVLHTEYIEWQRTLSGVHSILMEKSAQAGEGGGECQPLFTISTITHEVVVSAPAERADTLPLFLQYSTPISTLWYRLFTEYHWSEVGKPFRIEIEGVPPIYVISPTYFHLNRGKFFFFAFMSSTNRGKKIENTVQFVREPF
jgi:hypothetical protein